MSKYAVLRLLTWAQSVSLEKQKRFAVFYEEKSDEIKGLVTANEMTEIIDEFEAKEEYINK